MEKIINLQSLLLEQARDLYDAERQQLKAFPEFIRKVQSGELKRFIERHIRETQEQVRRLEDVFKQLAYSPEGEHCEAMAGLIRETEELIKRSADPEIMDAGLIATLQHIEHYEIAGYGIACSYARTLKLHEIADILHINLEEEKRIDERFSTLAEEVINPIAIAPVMV